MDHGPAAGKMLRALFTNKSLCIVSSSRLQRGPSDANISSLQIISALNKDCTVSSVTGPGPEASISEEVGLVIPDERKAASAAANCVDSLTQDDRLVSRGLCLLYVLNNKSRVPDAHAMVMASPITYRQSGLMPKPFPCFHVEIKPRQDHSQRASPVLASIHLVDTQGPGSSASNHASPRHT